MRKNNDIKGYFDLPSRIQKRIVKDAVREANSDQSRLVQEYDRRFGATKVAN